MPRKIKDELIKYVREYANRIIKSNNEVEILNGFKAESAAGAAQKAFLSNETLSESEHNFIESEGGYKKIVDFFDEKLLINYFMLIRDITYYEAKSLLLDKGTKAFKETEKIKHSRYVGKHKDYKATDKQISYIKEFNIDIKHENELSGREASLIISCLKTPKKTKPAYFSYYI